MSKYIGLAPKLKQNLHYGNFIDKNAVNPILQSGKKNAPLPPG